MCVCVCEGGGWDTEVVLVLEGEVQFHKEGVIQSSQHILLTTDIWHLLFSNDVPLVQNLHCRVRKQGKYQTLFQRLLNNSRGTILIGDSNL